MERPLTNNNANKTGILFLSLPLAFTAVLFLFACNHALLVSAQNSPPGAAAAVDVGVILNLGRTIGKMSLTSVAMAVEDFYAAAAADAGGRRNHRARVVLHFRDAENDAVTAAAAAVDLVKNVQVMSILGPPTSDEAAFVLRICNRSQVPVVSFSASSPSLSPAHNPFFVRATTIDSSQAAAVAAVVRHFSWRQAVLVYEGSEYGAGIVPFLIDALEAVDARVPCRSVLPSEASDDRLDEELYKLMSMQTRVFVVHMPPTLGARLFRRAHELGLMADGYVWIVTDGIANALGHDNQLDPETVAEAMQGVIGVRPYVAKSKEVSSFKTRFRQRFRRDHPDDEPTDPTVYQLWAYDAAWAVATAVEQVALTSPVPFQAPAPGNDSNATDLGKLGVSPSGPALLHAISNTRFQGLAGEFRLVDGQLQSPAFEIININAKSGRTIGFWTPVDGITKKLKSTNNAGLKSVIWPGDGGYVPRGWEIPTNGKKLRIAVPVKYGFDQFVRVETDAATNRTTVTGFCIDVFEAVIHSLPYAVSFDYIPVGDSSQSYNEFVYQVLKEFDAVVGDTTILANRSQYVDFTMPYTESGVSMIVPVKEDNNKNMWIFLKPLTMDLWLGSMAFFVFTGLVVWVIEYRDNEEFASSETLDQLGTVFYFAFSTLVFAHKENLTSNLSRLAVTIWVFVVLILTSSYTASLTSMLTVQQLQPTVTDVNQLLKTRANIGFQSGSFVEGMLQKMQFSQHRLTNYSTADQYAEALSKGSANGGVDAIFDEIPYLKLFLSQHCGNFTMVGPTYKTEGFGFVFPRGSPLVPDISKAILYITEGEKMTQIEKVWFGNPTSCPSQGNNLSSSSLAFQSFGGLFIITGVVSALALLVFLAKFIYQEWAKLKAAAGEQSSLWKKMVAVMKHYHDVDRPHLKRDEFDPLKKGEANRCPQSPVSISNHSRFSFPSPEEGISSTEPNSPHERRQESGAIGAAAEMAQEEREAR